MLEDPSSALKSEPLGDFGPADFLDASADYAATVGFVDQFPITGSEGQPLASRFAELANEWKRNTAFSSSLSEIVLDPAYQQIIGLGIAAVPYILSDLSKGPNHWYWALAAITQENPAANAPAGDIEAICDAWLRWGRRRGLPR
jgi:hypothetical protein